MMIKSRVAVNALQLVEKQLPPPPPPPPSILNVT